MSSTTAPFHAAASLFFLQPNAGETIINVFRFSSKSRNTPPHWGRHH